MKAPYHIITAVWGQAYTDLFLDVALPTQLSPGNLVRMAESADAVYRVFTSVRDRERIASSPAFARVAQLMRTEVRAVDELIGDESTNKYEALTACHRLAIEDARAANAPLIFLSPDLICSDGTFATVLGVAETGRRVIAACGLRVSQETVLPELPERSEAIAIPPRELVRVALGHLHPLTESLFWDSPTFTSWPSHLLWRVDSEGLLARCFHLHPLLVWPRRPEPLAWTIDGEYLARVCPDPADYHVVRDSDELVLCSIDRRPSHPPQAGRASTLAVGSWARQWAQEHHRRFVGEEIRFHSAELSNTWTPVEEEATAVVRRVLACSDSRALALGQAASAALRRGIRFASGRA